MPNIRTKLRDQSGHKFVEGATYIDRNHPNLEYLDSLMRVRFSSEHEVCFDHLRRETGGYSLSVYRAEDLSRTRKIVRLSREEIRSLREIVGKIR